MPDHVVNVTVGEQVFTGWQRVSIQRGLDQLAGTFDVTLTDRWALSGGHLQLLDGLSCVVDIDGVPVITGYIDDAAPQYDNERHEITISGRDRTADLVDCAALHPSQEINGRTLLQVAQSICQPFGITVRAEVAAAGRVPTTHIQPGETVYELLDRLARFAGVLFTSDAAGNLVMTRASTSKVGTVLSLGDNIKGASSRRSRRDRFSEYRVLGQHRPSTSSGDIFAAPSVKAAAQSSGVVTDSGVARYRPLVISAEDQANSAECLARAEWERSVRAGRGNEATITVRGWTDDDGGLWPVNRLVDVHDSWCGLSGTYLITGVVFQEDEDDGQTCAITVMPPAAFAVQPAVHVNPVGPKHSASLFSEVP